jgi:small-conductance mechanosensitive channel
VSVEAAESPGSVHWTDILDELDLQAVWNFPLIKLSSGNITVSQLVLAVLLVVLGIVIARLVLRLVERALAGRGVTPDAIHTLQRVLFYVVLVILVITALDVLNVPVTTLTFATGAVAIGVGFGAQNIINNLISGWILMSERPVRIGDFIEIDNSTGVVERIGNRSTRIRRVDGVHLLVPNSQMLERVVTNWTLVDDRIRTVVSVGVAYGSPVRKVEQLLHQAMSEHELVGKEPPPVVVFEDFGDNALIFQAYFWVRVKGAMEVRRIRSDLRFRIDELFAENGIVIAFPQRDLHFDSDRPLNINIRRDRQADDG